MAMESDPAITFPAENLRGSEIPLVRLCSSFEHNFIPFNHYQNQKIIGCDCADEFALTRSAPKRGVDALLPSCEVGTA